MRLATFFQQDPSYPLLFHFPESANEDFCFDPDGLIIRQNNINLHLHPFKKEKKKNIQWKLLFRYTFPAKCEFKREASTCIMDGCFILHGPIVLSYSIDCNWY